MEICNNSIDDNRNGTIDENCVCRPGLTQACWSGPGERRGVGMCRDGIQRCEEVGEFTAWGPCVGAALPNAEITGNCVDEDCDGQAPGCGTVSECSGAEICADGRDNDCNGLADCQDATCARDAACTAHCLAPGSEASTPLCSNAGDDDCDGLVDCSDPDCGNVTPCRPLPPPPPGCTRELPFFQEVSCGDGRDNDCDGAADCVDFDCQVPGQCGCGTVETSCRDGVDDDCDGTPDCGDIDCERCIPGTQRWCDTPTYCRWGHQDCGPDGRWGACIETTARPTGCTGMLYSASCCTSVGECCQNYPVDNSSIGQCGGIVTCG